MRYNPFIDMCALLARETFKRRRANGKASFTREEIEKELAALGSGQSPSNWNED